jgi:hypothetical protein
VTGLLAILGLVAWWAALAWLPLPYLWFYGGWLAAFGLAAVRSSRRVVWFNVALPLLLLFGLEAWAAVRTAVSAEGSAVEGYILPHDVLGYGPAPGYRAHARGSVEGEVVYDTHYNIDGHGLRVAPPIAADAGEECILFFGGSFTFGEGLPDDETLPYKTGLETGGRYRVYNFGFHGYGPHQMLAALEEGLVDRVLACRPRYVVYQGINSHIQRSAGLVYWDPHGPRFVLMDDGYVERRGHFDDGRWKWPPWLTVAIGRSHFFTSIIRWNRRDNKRDYDLYVGILETARRFVESRFRGSEFHIVMWDKPRRGITKDLQGRGFRVHRITEILPDRNANRTRYQLHARDKHPNALAFGEIARYLARELRGD